MLHLEEALRNLGRDVSVWALLVSVTSLGAIESPMDLPGFKPLPGTHGISDRGFSPLQGREESQGSKDAAGQGVRLSTICESAKRGGILTFPLTGPPGLLETRKKGAWSEDSSSPTTTTQMGQGPEGQVSYLFSRLLSGLLAARVLATDFALL